MTRAWEIAKEGAEKFGGKVKEYFQQALVIAWKEIKKGGRKVAEYTCKEIARENGYIYYAVSAVEGVKVSFLTQERSIRTGNTYMKRNEIAPIREMTNKETGEVANLYRMRWNGGDVEVTMNGQTTVFENYKDHKKWASKKMWER